MNSQEETVDQQLRSIATDWSRAQTIRQSLGERLALAKRQGASWRQIAHRTSIPMTDVRRWAAPYLADSASDEADPGGAA